MSHNTKKHNYTSNKRNNNSNVFNYNKRFKMSDGQTSSFTTQNDSSGKLIFDPRKSDCLSWELSKPKIIQVFDINKCWDFVNYHDYIITDEDGNVEIEEEELDKNPK